MIKQVDIRLKYEEYLEAHRELKATTMHEYKRMLKLFYDECAPEHPWIPMRAQADYEELIKTVALRHRWSSSTRHRMGGVLEQFGEYAYRERVVDRVPFRNTFKKRAGKRVEFFTEDDFQRLVFNPFHNARDIVMMFMLWDCGMRKGELIALNVGDLEITHHRIKIINNKTGKERINPIHEFTKPYLAHYLICLGVQGKLKPELPFFCSSKWERISSSCMGVKMQELEEMSRQRVFTHKFRHSLGGRIVSAGGDLRLVQDLLGHENLNTTAIYTHLRFQDKRNAYNKLLEKKEMAQAGQYK